MTIDGSYFGNGGAVNFFNFLSRGFSIFLNTDGHYAMGYNQSFKEGRLMGRILDNQQMWRRVMRVVKKTLEEEGWRDD